MTLESIPVFVRGGAFVFRQPVVQHTGEMAGQPLGSPSIPPRSPSALYEDDGESRAYLEGAFRSAASSSAARPGGRNRDLGGRRILAAGATRNLVLRVRVDGEPARVLLREADRAARYVGGSTVGSGVCFSCIRPGPGGGLMLSDDGFVEVVLPGHRGAAFSLALELTR